METQQLTLKTTIWSRWELCCTPKKCKIKWAWQLECLFKAPFAVPQMQRGMPKHVFVAVRHVRYLMHVRSKSKRSNPTFTLRSRQHCICFACSRNRTCLFVSGSCRTPDSKLLPVKSLRSCHPSFPPPQHTWHVHSNYVAELACPTPLQRPAVASELGRRSQAWPSSATLVALDVFDTAIRCQARGASVSLNNTCADSTSRAKTCLRSLRPRQQLSVLNGEQMPQTPGV